MKNETVKQETASALGAVHGPELVAKLRELALPTADREDADWIIGDAADLIEELEIDRKRLDWLLSGNGSMTIDVDSSLDWASSREAIDAAMFEERLEASEMDQ